MRKKIHRFKINILGIYLKISAVIRDFFLLLSRVA